MRHSDDCYICRLSRLRNKSILAARSGSRKQSEKWMKYWMDLYLDVSADNDYYEVVLDGSWPNAVEILERALARAKKNTEELTPNEPTQTSVESTDRPETPSA